MIFVGAHVGCAYGGGIRVARYVALLRGVNLAGKNKVPMPELRALFESLGHTEVSTYIQSGNVLLTSVRPLKPKSLETALHDQFGFLVAVMLRTPQELERVVASNPFKGADTSKLHVGFMAGEPSRQVVDNLDRDRFKPEEFVVQGHDLYLHLPNGVGRTKLPAYLDRQLKIPFTIRNWNTVMKLLELIRKGTD